MYNLLDDWAYVNDYNKFYNYDYIDAIDFMNYASDHINHEKCEFVFEKTMHQHKSSYWRDMKMGRIPARVAYESSYKTKFSNFEEDEYIVDCILGYQEFEKDAPHEDRREHLQDQIINQVSLQLNKPIYKSGLILHPKYPILSATPDAIGPDCVVELKCPVSIYTVRDFIHPNNILTNRSYAEIQLQMLLNNSKIGYFCLASPDFEYSNEITIIKVDLNHDYAVEMVKRATDFWCHTAFHELLRNLFKNC